MTELGRTLSGRTRVGRPPRPFWSVVDKSGECWLWMGVRNPEGYGMFVRTRGGRQRYTMAHRYAYELERGPIPEGLVMDHLCRVTSCVRPDHLEAVTQRVNCHRGFSPTALNARKTLCKRGHPFEDMAPNRRQCRTCRRKQWREWAQAARDRKKATA